MRGQKSPGGQPGQGRDKRTGLGAIVYPYSITVDGETQTQPRAEGLEIGRAVVECGLCRTAYRETLILSKRLAAESVRLANLFGYWRGEVTRLKAMASADVEDER